MGLCLEYWVLLTILRARHKELLGAFLVAVRDAFTMDVVFAKCHSHCTSCGFLVAGQNREVSILSTNKTICKLQTLIKHIIKKCRYL